MLTSLPFWQTDHFVEVKSTTAMLHQHFHLRRVYTFGFCMRFSHCVAIFYNLPWLSKIKVSYKKSQRNAVNACRNGMCKLSFINNFYHPLHNQRYFLLWFSLLETVLVNFTNILRKAFTYTDPKSAKKTESLTVFFALWESARVKAACKIWLKSTPCQHKVIDLRISCSKFLFSITFVIGNIYIFYLAYFKMKNELSYKNLDVI